MSVESRRFEGTRSIQRPRDVAEQIEPNATLLVSGFGSVGYPKAIPSALAEQDRDLSLTIISGGSVGDEIDQKLVNASAIERRCPYQSRKEVRDAINALEIHFHDPSVSKLGDDVLYGQICDPDIAIVEAIAVGRDWLIPSMAIGHTPSFVKAADRLIVEVNEAQPLALQSVHDCYIPKAPPHRDPIPIENATDRIGAPRIRFEPEKLMGVIRTNQADSPYEFREPTETDHQIAKNLTDFLSHEVQRSNLYREIVNVQFGVGSLGNALMGELGSLELEGRQLAYYGEVVQDGLLDLIDAGELVGTSAAALALSKEGQNRFFRDIERYTDSIVLRPATISNSPELINRLAVIAINSALEIDIYGHVNSTHLNGTHVINGVGGSPDFTRNSQCAIFVLPSTAVDGDVSRIVPMVPHVDHTEHDVEIFVTEQGVADLRGLSPNERSDCIIENCAHPKFRPHLQEYLDRARSNGGHIPHDIERCFDWHLE